MAKHVLEICKQNTLEVVGNSLNTYYATSEGKLVIVWKGKAKTFPQFTVGDTVTVDCAGVFPTVSFYIVEKDVDAILYKIFGKHSLAWSRKVEYEQEEKFRAEHRQLGTLLNCEWIDKKEFYCSELYKWTGDNDIGMYRCVYVDPELSMETFKEYLHILLHYNLNRRDSILEGLPNTGTVYECIKGYVDREPEKVHENLTTWLKEVEDNHLVKSVNIENVG